MQIADVFDHELLESKLRRLYDGYKKRFGDLLKYDVEEEITRFKSYTEQLQPFVIDEVPLLRSAKAAKSKILVEGAQAIMLDIGFGNARVDLGDLLGFGANGLAVTQLVAASSFRTIEF